MTHYAITKEFHFSASHVLHGLPEGHQCARLHGHNYVVAVQLEAHGLDARGFVFDYGDLAPLGQYIDSTFDHRHLNDILIQPTAEHLAEHLAQKCRQMGWPVTAIGVSETPKTWAWFHL